MERAEKSFLTTFIVSVIGGAYALSQEVWGLTIQDVMSLPIPKLGVIVAAAAVLISGLQSILHYLRVGFLVRRAVAIRPKD